MANTRFKTHHGVYSTANSFIDGKLQVTGDLVVDGNVAFSGTSQGDLKPDTDQRNLGNTTYRWNLIGFSANLASTLSVNGAVSVNNTINVVNASTLQNTLTVVGWVNTAANLVVGGSANISGQVNVAGNAAIVGIATANGNTSFTNGLLTVNTNGGTSANTLTVGAANLSVDSGVLFVDAINNRVGINNTAPGVALRVTGAVDISSTANVQGNANVGGTFGVAGATTLSGNVTMSGAVQSIAGNVAFDTSVLFVDSVNNRVGINNTAPGMALQVSGTANALSFTIGTDLISNTFGVYHTGAVNAAVLSTSGVLVNTTALVPTSNSILLGNSIGRWVFSANSIDITNNITSTGNMIVGNSTTNTVITSVDFSSSTGTPTTGTISVSGATTVTGVGTLFTTELAAGDVIKFSGCTSLFTVSSVTNTTQFILTSAGPTLSANTLVKRFTQVVNNSGVFITGGTQTIVPFSNTTNSSIGTSTRRWDVYSNAINSSGLITGSGGATFTGSVNATGSFNIGTIGASSNGIVANTTVITFGSSSVNVSINTSSVNVATYLSGAIEAASNGFLANSSSIRVGNTSTNAVITPTSIRVGNSSQNAMVSAGEIYIQDTFPNIIFVEDGAPTAGNVEIAVDNNYLELNWIPSGGSSNTKVAFDMIYGDAVFGSNSTHRILAESQYGRITTRGNVSGQEGGIRPHSNTDGHFLGGDLNRWYLFANTGNFSNNIIIGTRLQANSSNGTAGQVLLSGGPSGNVYWGSASVFNNDLTINQSSPAIYLNDTDNTTITANAMYMQFNAGSYTLVQSDDGDGTTNTRFTFAMSTGDLTIDGEFIPASDERKKDNIVTVDGALGLVDSMRGVYFTRKGSDEKHVGVIAQEIQKVLPEVVSEDADGYLAVSYGNIVGVLIEAIKELKQEIEELKNGNKG